MKFCFLALGALLALPTLALPALAQETTSTPETQIQAPTKKLRGFRPGVEVGFFHFNSSATGDTFGGNGISISPAFGSIRAATKHGDVRSDIGLKFSHSNGNTLVFVPLGARYVLGLSEKENQPYIGASLNAVPAYTKIDTLNLGGKFEVAVGGSAFAGYNFSDRFNVEARYFQISKVRSFDLSHFEVSAGVRF
ncbi:hypothetical protein IAD21_02000 [Abditibacteriota bacterium]|nr:hypothetical protein IAD21_02000 [Abditibacteriota bacterium]